MPPDAAVLEDLLDAAGLAPDARSDLLRRMGEATRHYHTADHLAALWAQHRRFAPAAGFTSAAGDRLLACAIAYHDAVFVAGARDNEARSAALWCQVAPASLASADVAWVARTILCTADHLADVLDDKDALGTAMAGLRGWMVDLDLTPLADTHERFTGNMALLRAEWAGGDGEESARRQLAFLQRVAAAPRIFRASVLCGAFEVSARANIAAALAKPDRPPWGS